MFTRLRVPSLSRVLLTVSRLPLRYATTVSSPLPDIELPTSNLYQHVYQDFAKHGPKIAMVDGITGREFSYNHLDKMTSKFSSGLKRLGFNQGDVLTIVTPNTLHYPVIMFGTLAMGGVISTSNPTFTEDELTYQFKNSNAKFVATVPAVLPTVRAAADKAGIKTIIVVDESDNTSSDKSLVAYNTLIQDSGSLFNPVSQDMESLAVLPYSSGTTGLPKGVMLSHCNVTSNISQNDHNELFNLRPDGTTLLGLLPFYHIAGMVLTLFSLTYGTEIVVLPKFEPEVFLASIQNHRVTLAHLVPPLLLFLAKHPDVEKYDLSSLNEIMSSAAPLGRDLVSATQNRINCPLIRQGYGSTEVSGPSHLMPKSLGMSKPDSVGQPVRSVRSKVVHLESGEDLPANMEGEVLSQGPNVMRGYLNKPDATQECIDEDGWFRTGDIGYHDGDGFLYITDRLKELIKVKGLQVAPAELEAVLVTHPGIADAAVVGIPHERHREAPKAFVVKRDDKLTEKEVADFIGSKVAKHKHLVGGIEFIDKIPKTASGKILRRMLKKKL